MTGNDSWLIGIDFVDVVGVEAVPDEFLPKALVDLVDGVVLLDPLLERGDFEERPQQPNEIENVKVLHDLAGKIDLAKLAQLK
jgi:hypothetical protein